MEDRVRCLAFVSGSEGRKRRDRRGSRPRSGASDVPPNRASSPTLRRPSSSRTDSSSETSVSSSSPGSRLRGTSPGLRASAGSPRTPPRTEGRAGRRQRLSRLLLVSTISSHSWAPTILHGGRRRRRVPPHTEGRAGRRLRLSRLLLLVSTRDSPRLSRECLERPGGCKRRRDFAPVSDDTTVAWPLFSCTHSGRRRPPKPYDEAGASKNLPTSSTPQQVISTITIVESVVETPVSMLSARRSSCSE